MGFRLRKSINLGGGFRINISKSGVGYSWGVPGYRITKTAKGKTRRTYSIPGSGISYVSESSGKSNQKKKSPPPKALSYENLRNEESSDIQNFRSAEHADLIKHIQRAINLNTIALIGLIIVGMFSFQLFFPLVILEIVAYLYFSLKVLPITLDYKFESDDISKTHNQRLEIWKQLNKSNKVWRVIQTARVKNKKNAAGAGSQIKRELLKIQSNLPFFIKTNVEVITLKSSKESLIFLPDKILIQKKGNIGVLDYTDLKFDVYARGMIEYPKKSEAKDAITLRQTWLHPNKDGGPDKRYKDNKLVPVYKYGCINLSSPQGLNFKIMASNATIVESLESIIKQQNNL